MALTTSSDKVCLGLFSTVLSAFKLSSLDRRDERQRIDSNIKTGKYIEPVLHYVCRHGKCDRVVPFLAALIETLDHKDTERWIDLNAENKEGETALDVARNGLEICRNSFGQNREMELKVKEKVYNFMLQAFQYYGIDHQQ